MIISLPPALNFENTRTGNYTLIWSGLISESEVSITILCLLCSPHYTAVRIKNCSKSMSVIQSSHREKYDSAARPSYRSIHCPSLSAMFDSLHSSTNQEVFEKHFCIKSSHYEKYGRFLVTQGSHHVQQKGGHW